MKELLIRTLRVNIKNLSDESRNIREEIKRSKNRNVKESLHLHRVFDVRKESRHTQLTLAAVKGIPYEKVERNTDKEPVWKKIFQKLDRHLPYPNLSESQAIKEQVGKWAMEASNYFKQQADKINS